MTQRVFALLSFVLLVSLTQGNAQANRSLDGNNNNINNPEWGAAQAVMPRICSVDYADGISVPKLDETNNRPNPRVVSNRLFEQKVNIHDRLNLSDYIWVFGQFLDHDISLVEDNPAEVLTNIVIPEDDQHFTPGNRIFMSRSMPAAGTGTSTDNPRQHANHISSFIDGSAVYGSDLVRASWLRTFTDGKLKVSEGNLLPWNTVTGEFNDAIDPQAPNMADDTHQLTKMFVAGDVRANENPLLLSFHTLFVREHNRLCDVLKSEHPQWTDEVLYQQARKMVGGFIQKITFEEWLPAMGVNLAPYAGYKSEVNPGVTNEFSAAAFRIGHTLINSNLIRIKNDGDDMPGGSISLRDAFFNPYAVVLSGGIEPFVKGMAIQVQQEMDCKIIDDVRNFLFGAPGQGGLDLAAININRGRDRGIPTYNTIREDMGLPKVNSFFALTKDQESADVMEDVYGDVDHIDAWVGMVSEAHVDKTTLLGEVMIKILTDQFEALRDGDRYYYENDSQLSDAYKDEIRKITLREIIMRNTSVTLMQQEVFKAMPHEMISRGPDVVPFNLSAALYPNPTNQHTTLKFHSDIDQIVLLQIVDYMGKVVETKELHAYPGENYHEMVLSDHMPRGLYNIVLSTESGYSINKLVKE